MRTRPREPIANDGRHLEMVCALDSRRRRTAGLRSDTTRGGVLWIHASLSSAANKLIARARAGKCREGA